MTPDEFFELPRETINEYELAYGRKSWELVKVLATLDDVDKGEGILTYDAWDNLMHAMEEIGPDLDRIAIAFNHEANAPVDYPEYIFTDEDKQYIAKYEYWYDKTFNDTPYLGYEFSVGYMMSFWEAKDKVYEVLADPEYEVYMCISY